MHTKIKVDSNSTIAESKSSTRTIYIYVSMVLKTKPVQGFKVGPWFNWRSNSDDILIILIIINMKLKN